MRLAPFTLLALSGVALAQGSPPTRPALTLEWRATSCSSHAEVLDEIARILRGASGSQRQVVARVTVDQVDRGAFRVALVTQGGGVSRQRSFEAESCAAAVEAVALILAITINPQVTMPPGPDDTAPVPAPPTEPAAPAPAPAPTPASTPASTSTPDSASIGAANASPRTRLSVHGLTLAAALATDTGSLPNATIGAELALGWRPGRLRFEIAGTYWAPETATEASSTAGARFQLLSAAARAAYAWPLGRFAMGPLVGLGLESFHASGFGGTLANGSAEELLGAVAAGALLTWQPASRLLLRLAIESVFPLSRPSFVVLEPSAPSSVHRPSPAFGRALFGGEVQF
jgi:hypothetical protein